VNLRFLVLLDPLLRLLAARFLGSLPPIWAWAILAGVCALDLAIFWALRGVYDPTTASLARALGMIP
jgi:hypothetical protein